jgi:hypothetical protein
MRLTQRNPSSFNDTGTRGAHRIAVQSLGLDLVAPSSLQGVVNAEHDSTCGHKSGDHRQQQQPGGAKCVPYGAVQHAMIVLKMALVTEAHGAQDGGHSALATCEDCPNQQRDGMLPDSFGKQRGEC